MPASGNKKGGKKESKPKGPPPITRERLLELNKLGLLSNKDIQEIPSNKFIEQPVYRENSPPRKLSAKSAKSAKGSPKSRQASPK